MKCDKCKQEFKSANGFKTWNAYTDKIKYYSCENCAEGFIFFLEAQPAYQQLFQNILDLFFAPSNPCMLEEETEDV